MASRLSPCWYHSAVRIEMPIKNFPNKVIHALEVMGVRRGHLMYRVTSPLYSSYTKLLSESAWRHALVGPLYGAEIETKEEGSGTHTATTIESSTQEDWQTVVKAFVILLIGFAPSRYPQENWPLFNS